MEEFYKTRVSLIRTRECGEFLAERINHSRFKTHSRALQWPGGKNPAHGVWHGTKLNAAIKDIMGNRIPNCSEGTVLGRDRNPTKTWNKN